MLTHTTDLTMHYQLLNSLLQVTVDIQIHLQLTSSQRVCDFSIFT